MDTIEDKLQLESFCPTWELVLRHRPAPDTSTEERMIVFDDVVDRMVTPLPELLKQMLEMEYQHIVFEEANVGN